MDTNNNKVESINVKVTRVSLYENTDGKISVNLITADEFNGMVKQNDKFVPGKTNRLSFNRSNITRMLTNVSDDIAMLRSMQVEAFDQREFALLLVGSKLDLQREHLAEGEEYEGYKDGKQQTLKADREMYLTTITGITINKRGKKAIDDALQF